MAHSGILVFTARRVLFVVWVVRMRVNVGRTATVGVSHPRTLQTTGQLIFDFLVAQGLVFMIHASNWPLADMVSQSELFPFF